MYFICNRNVRKYQYFTNHKLKNMKFLIDECVGKLVHTWLKQNNYETICVQEENKGVSDHWVLQKAFDENRILITCDKDFGDMIFRDQKEHRGIILLRLEDENTKNKIHALDLLLKNYQDQIKNNFIVVSDKNVRIIKQ